MRFPRLPLLATMALAALAIYGCGTSPSGSTNTDTNNLSLPFGGYSAANEKPAFGDPSLASTMGDEPLFEDPMFPHDDLDELLDSLNQDRQHQIYMLAIRWGQLEGDSGNTVLTDFSGSLQLDRGAIIVRKLLRFESGQDHIVWPRTSRTLLEWVSQTSVHFDGLLVMIVDPLSPPDSTWPPNQLVFTTGLYNRTFTMPELQTLDEIVTVDLLGNQIAFNARRLDLIACGDGVLDGVWHLNPSKQNGEFSGRWMTADGIFRGHLRGHFGRRPNGDMPFFGKVIGVDGHFAGLLRGTWGFDADDSTMGWFEGTWASRMGLPEGAVSGQWVSDPTAGSGDDDDGDDEHGEDHGQGHDGDDHGHDRNDRWGKGFFSGTWSRDCDADSSNGG